MAESNPFSTVYAALTDAIRDGLALTEGGKLDRFDNNRGSRRMTVRNLTPGETADGFIEVWPTGVTFDPAGDNSRSRCMRPQYAIGIETPNLNTTIFNAALWAVVVALEGAEADLGLPRLVRNWVLSPASFSTISPHPENPFTAVGEARSEKAAWSVVGVVDVEIYVLRSVLVT